MAISLVQSKTANAASLTLTSATTAGNCLVVGYTDEAGASNVSAVTLGGSAGNFGSVVQAAGAPAGSEALASLWADPSCAGGQTAVAATATGHGTGNTLWAAEFSGLLATSSVAALKDQTNSATGSSATWTTGNSAGTPGAGELWIGVCCAIISSATAAVTSPVWNSITQDDGTGNLMLFAWKVVPSPGGPAVFNGTGGGISGVAMVVATLNAAVSVARASPVSLNQAVNRSAVW